MDLKKSLFNSQITYIPQQYHDNVRNFKYVSTGMSYAYYYITSPLSEFIVSHLPTNLAPNLITLFAFICVITLNLLTLYFNGFDSTGTIPDSIILICGCLYMSYHILDCCDGKQARRLKKGSPLGYIMDHNLDSFSTVLLSISSTSIVRLNNPIFKLVIFCVCTITFFIATWEEYQTGAMNLPSINGVDEGAFFMTGLFLFTGFVGSSFWENRISDFPIKSLNGYHYNEAFTIIVLVICIIFTSISIKNVFFSNSKINAKDALLNFLLFTFMNLSLVYVILASSADSYIIKYPTLAFYLYGSLFSKLTGHLQICNLGKFQLNQIRKSIIFLCIMLPLNILLLNYNILSIDFHNFICIVLLIISLVVYSHFFICTTGELCDILNINRFTLEIPQNIVNSNRSTPKKEKY